jgi:hypothetical protein
MSAPLSKVVLLLAGATVLAGWGSCGGTRFDCTYSCPASESGSHTTNVTTDTVEKANTQCRQEQAGSCPDVECSCQEAPPG